MSDRAPPALPPSSTSIRSRGRAESSARSGRRHPRSRSRRLDREVRHLVHRPLRRRRAGLPRLRDVRVLGRHRPHQHQEDRELAQAQRDPRERPARAHEVPPHHDVDPQPARGAPPDGGLPAASRTSSSTACWSAPSSTPRASSPRRSRSRCCPMPSASSPRAASTCCRTRTSTSRPWDRATSSTTRPQRPPARRPRS